MSSLEELLKQKADIEQQIEKEKTEGKKVAIDKVRILVREYGISATDLKGYLVVRGRGAAKKTRAKRKTKVAATA
jgi:DNA-binding protein H-NS